jgi:putative hemolysin
LSKEALGTDSVKGENAREFRSLGGFVMARLRRVPQEGKLIEASGYCFEVVDVDGLRVDKLLVTPHLHKE